MASKQPLKIVSARELISQVVDTLMMLHFASGMTRSTTTPAPKSHIFRRQHHTGHRANARSHQQSHQKVCSSYPSTASLDDTRSNAALVTVEEQLAFKKISQLSSTSAAIFSFTVIYFIRTLSLIIHFQTIYIH